jgi:putative ABC transport system permease protein
MLANCLAWPIAYLIMRSFLNNFAYHVTIGISIFLLATILVSAVAIATMAYKTIKTARANPVQSLRYE